METVRREWKESTENFRNELTEEVALAQKKHLTAATCSELLKALDSFERKKAESVQRVAPDRVEGA